MLELGGVNFEVEIDRKMLTLDFDIGFLLPNLDQYVSKNVMTIALIFVY